MVSDCSIIRAASRDWLRLFSHLAVEVSQFPTAEHPAHHIERPQGIGIASGTCSRGGD